MDGRMDVQTLKLALLGQLEGSTST